MICSGHACKCTTNFQNIVFRFWSRQNQEGFVERPLAPAVIFAYFRDLATSVRNDKWINIEFGPVNILEGLIVND
jgi:hypothetical protein